MPSDGTNETIEIDLDAQIVEISRAPIEGGDFSILKNPFVLLGLPPTAAPAAVKEAYEDAVEEELDTADVLMRAQQTLLTPRLRIEAEVGGFLDVDQRLAAEIVSDIRSGAPIEDIGERLSKLHSLPRSNVIAHYGSARPFGMNALCDLIDAQAAVMPGAVCDAINDARAEMTLGRVDREAVSEALSRLLDRQTRAVVERIGSAGGAIDFFDRFVSKVVADADSPTLFRLDVYVRTFAQVIAPELSKRGEAVAAAFEEIKEYPKSEAAFSNLNTALRNWVSLLHPIQTYEIYRQREDATTREMYGRARELMLWLANEKEEFESAGKIVSIASDVFGHLPRAAAQMTEDAAQLLALRNKQLADEHLTPLLQACEEINESHRTFASELLRTGFAPGSTGSAKALFDKFSAAVGTTAKLPFADAPWQFVRGVAISLNNDSAAPRAAESLIQGLLDFAEDSPPTAEIMKMLREDQRVVRKIQVEAELGKSIEAQKWGEADRLAGRLLSLETDEQKLTSIRELRARIATKRKAQVRTRWFWAVATAGFVILIAMSGGERKPQSSSYRPPPWPSATVQTGPYRPADTSEVVPPVGSELSLSQSNIRYCSYQGIRLDSARAMIVTEYQRQRFNAGVHDFNSRCGSYRYFQSDRDTVDAELPGKRFTLEAEGRSLVASWQAAPRAGAPSKR
jgi:hypothetical protein